MLPMPMTSDQLEQQRQKLLLRAQEIDAQMLRSLDSTPAVAPDAAIGRLTRVDAVQAGFISDEVRRQISAERARIERALRQIDEGTYGICRACDADLSEARLHARPDATLCVPCAELAEQRSRRGR